MYESKLEILFISIARNPWYERRNVAGHNWDGGRPVVMPRDRNEMMVTTFGSI